MSDNLRSAFHIAIIAYTLTLVSGCGYKTEPIYKAELEKHIYTTNAHN